MGGFGGTRTVIKEVPAKQEVSAAQARQEARAEASEERQQQGVQRRRRLQRSGGMRLLFSPLRQEGPGAVRSTKLGGGS